MVDDLENKAVEMLISLTESLTEAPASLLGLYATLLLNSKNDPEALKGVNELARLFISKIPELTHVLSDSTKTLETYVSYKIYRRQEEATNGLLEQNKNLVKQTRNLTRATLIIAGANVILVAYTILRLYF